MLEIDNVAYAIGMPEWIRAQIEADGRVEVDDAEAAVIFCTKAVHLFFIAVLPAVAVQFFKRFPGLQLCVFLAFLVGGIFEACMLGVDAIDTAKRATKVTCMWLLGLVLNFYVAVVIASGVGVGTKA